MQCAVRHQELNGRFIPQILSGSVSSLTSTMVHNHDAMVAHHRRAVYGHWPRQLARARRPQKQSMSTSPTNCSGLSLELSELFSVFLGGRRESKKKCRRKLSWKGCKKTVVEVSCLVNRPRLSTVRDCQPKHTTLLEPKHTMASVTHLQDGSLRT